MQVTIKKIVLENYKCFYNGRNLSADFFHRTRIAGENRKGKSTIQDAYFDIMTGKMSDGTQTDNVRPHDENGVDINKIDIIRELHLEIDGKPTVIRKVTKQKWRKPHSQNEEVFDGNVTAHEIDGFPMKQKQMTEFFEKIAKADTLLMCSNAQAFLNILQKSMPDARKLLENLIGFDANQFAQENSYTEVQELMKGHSAEDVLKKLRKQILDEKDKIKAQNEVIKAKNAEFIDKEKHPIEISDLELAKGEWREKLAEIDRQEEQLNQSTKDYDDLAAEIRGLKAGIEKISQTANADLVQRRGDLLKQISEKKANKSAKESESSAQSVRLEMIEKDIERYNEELQKARNDWSEWSARTFDRSKLHEIEAEEFDKNSLICPTCFQKFPKERAEKIKADFEENKQNRIDEQEIAEQDFYKKKNNNLRIITEHGNSLKKSLESEKATKTECEKKTDEIKQEIQNIAEEVEQLTAELAQMPKEIDLSGDTVYQAALHQIADKEKELSSLNNGADKRAELRNKRNEYMNEIANIDGEIKYISEFETAKENSIADYTAKLRDMAQVQADLERQYELIKEFSRRKNEALASQINPHFRHFQFNFVKYTIEGNPYEVCEIVCNGTSYFNGLNGGDKRLCEIDLCRGFQELNNIVLPIWVDEANTIDDWRIPQDLEQQLILMERQNGELKVEEVE